MVAAAYRIYTSSDSGATWDSSDAPNTNWVALVSSADGGKLAAAVKGGPIYSSQGVLVPKLIIAPAASGALISWTIPSQDLLLQQCSSLVGAEWSEVVGQPNLNYSNLQYQLTVPVGAGAMFYRLLAMAATRSSAAPGFWLPVGGSTWR
jgi:hypothetical protein